MFRRTFCSSRFLAGTGSWMPSLSASTFFVPPQSSSSPKVSGQACQIGCNSKPEVTGGLCGVRRVYISRAIDLGCNSFLSSHVTTQRRFLVNAHDEAVSRLEEQRKAIRGREAEVAAEQTALAKHKSDLANLEAETQAAKLDLAKLKEALAIMEAVLFSKLVPEEPRGFANYFASLPPDVQRSAYEAKEADIRTKEADIRDKEAEVRATRSRIDSTAAAIRKIQEEIAAQTRAMMESEDSLVVELQRKLHLQPRRLLRLTDSKSNKEFLGRQEQLGRAMAKLRKQGELKEDQQPVVVYSSPRQGKSRLMDEVARNGMAELGPEKLFVVAISYNGVTAENCGQLDVQVDSFAARFFCRMLLASVSVYGAEPANEWTARFPRLRTLDSGTFDRILRRVHGLSDQVIWLLADEFSKCYLTAAGKMVNGTTVSASLKKQISEIYSFMGVDPRGGNKLVLSGFADSAVRLLQSASGRPVVKIALPLIDAKQRHLFHAMKSTLWDHYRAAKKPFPAMMYEIVKSCVGMTGFWIEVCADGDYPMDLTSLEVPWIVMLRACRTVYLGVAERYLQRWGIGSLQIAHFIGEEATYFDAADVGASVMFLPLSDRLIAHPVPFYTLVQGVCTDWEATPLAFQLAEVYEKVSWAVLAMVGAHEETRSATRGLLVEEITFRILRMRCHALALQKKPRSLRAWLDGWISSTKCSRIPGEILLLPETKPLLKDGKVPFTCSLKTLFDGTKPKNPNALQQDTQRFCEEVSSSGGMLLAPDRNPGFDMVVALRATRDGRQGLVLVLVETKCIRDYDLARDTAKKFDGKVSVNGRPLQLKGAERKRPHKESRTLSEPCSECESESQEQPAIKFCATRKAWLSLHGLNASLPYFEKPVLHVCYVFLTLGKYAASFDEETTYVVKSGQQYQNISLRKAIDDTGKKGATVSLHVVSGQQALEDFFTGAVYHAIPDAEVYLEPEAVSQPPKGVERTGLLKPTSHMVGKNKPTAP